MALGAPAQAVVHGHSGLRLFVVLVGLGLPRTGGLAFPPLVPSHRQAVPPVRDTALSTSFRFEPPLARLSSLTPFPLPKSGMTHVMEMTNLELVKVTVLTNMVLGFEGFAI